MIEQGTQQEKGSKYCKPTVTEKDITRLRQKDKNSCWQNRKGTSRVLVQGIFLGMRGSLRCMQISSGEIKQVMQGIEQGAREGRCHVRDAGYTFSKRRQINGPYDGAPKQCP